MKDGELLPGVCRKHSVGAQTDGPSPERGWHGLAGTGIEIFTGTLGVLMKLPFLHFDEEKEK